jgi:tetratricopeptide (TPR) repeat protein
VPLSCHDRFSEEPIMSTRSRTHLNASVDVNSTHDTRSPNPPVGESRPFADPLETADIIQEQPQPEVGDRAGHTFSQVAVDAPAGTTLQAKLTVGEPNDQYEQEADRVAAQVMSMGNTAQQPLQRQTNEEDEVQMKPLAGSITPLVQRQPSTEEDEELQMRAAEGSLVQRQATSEDEDEIQMKAIQRQSAPEEEEDLQMKAIQRSPNGSAETSTDLEGQLNQTKGGGSALTGDVQSFMESRFGVDFSNVRVHTDSTAVAMNQSLGAQAFTHGQDVYFGSGKYDPGSHAGKELLAHELTHVVQQTGGAAPASVQRDTPEPTAETRTADARQQFYEGQALYSAGDYAGALDKFRAVYSLMDDNSRASMAYNMAVCHQRLGEFDDAIAMYQERLSFSSVGRSERALVLENIRRSRMGETEPATEAPHPTAQQQSQAIADGQALQTAASAAFAAGDFAGALELFTQIYADPNLPANARQMTAFNMGVCHQRLGEFPQAISMFEEYAQFTGVTEAQRREALEYIRQCRSGFTELTAGADNPTLTVDEQHAIFDQAQAAFTGGQYQAALELYNQIYGTPNADEHVRRSMLYNMGMCHQRLGQFEQAVSMFQEYLVFPGLPESDRQNALMKIRQCRQGQVGTNATMEDPNNPTISGNERLLMHGSIFFDTGSAQPNQDGQATANIVTRIVQEQHASHPNATFRIAVVGQASRRWSNPGSSNAYDLNMQLSQQRTDSVVALFQSSLPAAELQSGVYTISPESMGEDFSDTIGLSANNNYWRMRTTQITVWMTDGTTPGTP